MIPKPEEVLIEAIGQTRWNLDGSVTKAQLNWALKEYGRRLLDHVAEVAKTKKTGNSGSWFDASVDKQSILKIKDEL